MAMPPPDLPFVSVIVPAYNCRSTIEKCVESLKALDYPNYEILIMDDEDYMGLALEEAEIALKEGNWPIGCVITLDNKIISRGRNRVYTLRDRTAHAEIMAIREVPSLLFDENAKAEI